MNVWTKPEVWPAAAPGEAWIGRSVKRREDARLIRGAGRYVDDITPDDCLCLEFVRSAHPHGVITAIDVKAARACPNVVAVFTHRDLAIAGQTAVNPLVADIRPPRFTVLADTTIGAVGQPIAAVVGRTALAARDACEQIDVTVEALAPLAGGPETKAISGHWRAGKVEQAFADAAHVVTIAIEHPRLAPMPLEPRAALAEWNDAEAALTVWLSTQTPHRARSDLANMLDLPEAKIRVIAPDVGGAFGGKASIYPEDVMVAWAAWVLRRPVKWCATRSEDFQAATHGRGARTAGELAVSADGRALGLRARLEFPLGHWLPYSAAAPGRNASRILPGPYRIDAVDIDLTGTLTSTAAVGIYRGAGRPEACMLMERLMDRAAAVTGIDPVAIRLRNLIEPDSFPYSTPTGETFDSGNFPALVEKACALAAYEMLCRDRAKRRRRGEVAGVGAAVYVEPCGNGWESACISLAADGKIIAATGSSSQGQGRETAYVQIVCDVLQVSPDRVIVVHGDTGTTPAGIGALASRSTAIGGSALKIAATRFLDKARTVASSMSHVSPDQLQSVSRGFANPAGKLSASWPMLVQRAFADGIDVADNCALVTTETYHAKGEAWSSGCCIASVSVDADTSEIVIEKLVWVDDAGVVVNPMLVHGQLVGGMAQGIGETLMEQIVYDPNGQLITGSLMDYAVPRSTDVPHVIIDRIETVSTANVLGAKGVGEAGCIGVPAAIVNAVVDALSVHGVNHLDMPLTSEKIWRALVSGSLLKETTVT
ncbi:MAG: aerobic carbon-monoxide dehydrogenase large subunit [Acetobacteraceae bacterium]|nr:aerobic carbon-monoxide dehydrogenase large subunit [Acetobacteraceae bacterium]